MRSPRGSSDSSSLSEISGWHDDETTAKTKRKLGRLGCRRQSRRDRPILMQVRMKKGVEKIGKSEAAFVNDKGSGKVRPSRR